MMTMRPAHNPAIRSQPLDDGDVRLSAALAHGLQTVACAAPLELVQQRRHEARAGRAERVAEGDAAAVHVDAREVRVELALPGEHHGGERLVDLDQVDVGEPESALLER